MIPSLVLLPIVILVVFALLLVVLGFSIKNPHVLWGIALGGLLASLLVNVDLMGVSWSRAIGLHLWPVPGSGESGLLSDLSLNVSPFALFFNLVFLTVALLTIIASRSYLKTEEPHQAEYYGLLFLALTGMMLVAAATDLFVLYLAFELSSLSTFALVAFRKKDKRATEASLKFFIIGAVSSALILFGISVLFIVAGSLSPGGATTSLNGLRAIVSTSALQAAGLEAPFIIAVIFLLAGFGFKVATVPFHMWAPDVYEGSPTTISVFLAAGSKKVGVAAMFQVFLVALLAAQVDWQLAIAGLAIATMTVGNVLAIPQRNIKRMLAYSSIAQAGYILISLVVATVAVNAASSNPSDPALNVASYGLAGGFFHVFTHAIMKAGAFLVVAAASVLFIGEDLDGWKGLGKRNPFLAFAMTAFLLSLAGIPPFGGFFSKFVLFSGAVFASGLSPALGGSPWFLWLAVAGVLNSALSLYYYARVIRYMYILEPTDERKVVAPTSMNVAIGIALVGIIVTGIFANPLISYMQNAAHTFLFP